MNQIQFETSKVFGVFVILPDGASNPRLWDLHNERPYITYVIDGITHRKNNLKNNNKWLTAWNS